MMTTAEISDNTAEIILSVSEIRSGGELQRFFAARRHDDNDSTDNDII